MEYIPWFGWIVIVAIIAGAIITVANAMGGRRSEMAEALRQNADLNQKLIARLDDIEARLGSVEKTLNEIPE